MNNDMCYITFDQYYYQNNNVSKFQKQDFQCLNIILISCCKYLPSHVLLEKIHI